MPGIIELKQELRDNLKEDAAVVTTLSSAAKAEFWIGKKRGKVDRVEVVVYNQAMAPEESGDS